MYTEVFTISDLHNINDLRPDDWSDIRKPHLFYLSHPFCHTIKIVLDGRLAGIGTRIKHENSSWLAHIIVHKDYRGKGLGKLIVSDLVSQINSDPLIKTISLIATDLGFPVYEKVGFREQTIYNIYVKSSEFHHIFPTSNSVFPYQIEMKSDILQLDKQISGENRIDYLESFLPDTCVFKTSGRITGFYIPQLGDGLILAENESAGIELLKLKIRNCDKIVIPRENIIGHEFLLQNGFENKKSCRRMILGDQFKWKPQDYYNRIGGNLG